jgi:hypothetical protein
LITNIAGNVFVFTVDMAAAAPRTGLLVNLCLSTGMAFCMASSALAATFPLPVDPEGVVGRAVAFEPALLSI